MSDEMADRVWKGLPQRELKPQSSWTAQDWLDDAEEAQEIERELASRRATMGGAKLSDLWDIALLWLAFMGACALVSFILVLILKSFG
jgi:hypothetical protein